LFAPATHPCVQQLAKLEPNSMTPIQALEMLSRMVDEVKRESARSQG
jgi:hypothetical protein